MRAGRLGSVSVGLVLLGSLSAYAPVSVPTPECTATMRAAAPITDTNDDSKLLATLVSCSSEDDWLASMRAHPGPGTLRRSTRSDALVLLDVLCSELHDGPVCAGAEAAGDIEG